MAWNPLTTAEIASGKAVTTTKINKIKDCLEYLYGEGALLKGSVPNGGFELDADSDGIPDGWTQSLFAGGTGAFDTAAPMEALHSYKFVHPGGAGNGGGTLTSDYLECSEYVLYTLYALHYTSVTGIKDKIQVKYYTKAKVANGSVVDLYNSSACAAAPERLSMPFKPTANSRYFKVVLTGGHGDLIAAGTSYFDDIYYEKTVTPTIKRLLTQVSKSQSTVLTIVSNLTVNVLAGLTYHFNACLLMTTREGGFKVAVDGTCTATNIDYIIDSIDTSGCYAIIKTSLGDPGGAVVDSSYVVNIEGTIIVNASGNLYITFAQFASALNVSVLLVGSSFIVTPVA